MEKAVPDIKLKRVGHEIVHKFHNMWAMITITCTWIQNKVNEILC